MSRNYKIKDIYKNLKMAEANLTVDHFKETISRESNKFVELCSKWRTIINNKEDNIPDDILGDINVAIGQTELLKRKRFTQFRKLIEDCEFNTGEQEITCRDLQGFWDIIYFQVENVLEKFSELEKLKSNQWKVDVVVNQRPPVKPALKKKVLQNSNMKPKSNKPAVSNLKAHMLAAKKLMRQQLNPEAMDVNVAKQSNGTPNKENIPNIHVSPVTMNQCSPLAKKFDAGFFKVVTPQRCLSTNKTTPANPKDIKLLSSSVLKVRISTPPVHKEIYLSCMRITRSMKKRLEDDNEHE